MTAATDVRIPVNFWFDPLCPYAWVTSRWMIEVMTVRPVDVAWHIMSLAVINEDKADQSDKYRAWLERAWYPVRVVVAAEQEAGSGVVLPLYTAIGERVHPGERGRTAEDLLAVLAEALAEVGLPAHLIDAATDASNDEAIRTTTANAMTLVGEDVGTPVLGVADWGIFGPVLTRVPRGDDAGDVWDATLVLGPRDDFWELKRTRTEDPQFD